MGVGTHGVVADGAREMSQQEALVVAERAVRLQAGRAGELQPGGKGVNIYCNHILANTICG